MNILIILYHSNNVGIIYYRSNKGGVIIKNYGLVLGGGGMRGAYEVGVYKALLEKNINVVSVVGTSIGAINGAFIASHEFKALYDL